MLVNFCTTSSDRFSVAHYLRLLTLFVISWLIAVASINLLIDPLGVFGAPIVDGLNRVKHGIRTHTRTAKAYAVRFALPQTIILGSSRAESAFRPAYPGFRSKPVYNLAFSGAGIYEILRYFQHATAVAPVKEALVSIDFGMFDATHARPTWDFDERRLAVSRNGIPSPLPWRDLISLILSGDALKESIWSARHQKDLRTTYGPDGLRDESFDIPEILNEYGGHRKTFNHNEQGFACGFQSARTLFRFHIAENNTLGQLEELLSHAKRHHVTVTLLIPPVHARHLEVIAQSGLGSLFEEWKVQLTSLAEKYDTTLWDFAQVNSVTSEPVPPFGDSKTAMHWFRESSHALSATGTAALDRIYGSPRQISDFGHRLTSKSIDALLRADRLSLSAWRSRNPQDVAEIQSLLPRCAPGMTRYSSR